MAPLTDCPVCADRQLEAQRVHELNLAWAQRAPAAPARRDDDETDSWLLALVIAAAFALIGVIMFRVRELGDQVELLADQDVQPEEEAGERG